MGRPRRNQNSNRKSNVVDVSDTEEYADKVDTSASNFIYDAVDEYHENKDREGMQKLTKLMRKPKAFSEVNEMLILWRSSKFWSSSFNPQEAVLGVATSSDEEETLQKKRKKKKKKKLPAEAEPLPELDSDLDEEKIENEDNMPSTWGSKKSAYYNADYVDEDIDGTKHLPWQSSACDSSFYLPLTDADESDVERAELELKEALAIQQQMAEQIDEADFELDFISRFKVTNYIQSQWIYSYFCFHARLQISYKGQKNYLLKKWKLMSTFHSYQKGKNSSFWIKSLLKWLS